MSYVEFEVPIGVQLLAHSLAAEFELDAERVAYAGYLLNQHHGYPLDAGHADFVSELRTFCANSTAPRGETLQ